MYLAIALKVMAGPDDIDGAVSNIRKAIQLHECEGGFVKYNVDCAVAYSLVARLEGTPGVVGLVVGDVSGKGMPAALFMAMARALLRVGLKSTRSPSEALKLLNAGLADDLSNADLFLTLFVATFDPAARELRAVNCGQSPVLLFQGGQVSEWEADSPPIGVASELSSAERSLSLQSGDVLIVMSDGFSEARDAGGGRIGIGPLKETVLRAAGRSAPDIAAALLQRAEASERDSNLSDDQTLIVLKVE